jgi:hypothetical protein
MLSLHPPHRHVAEAETPNRLFFYSKIRLTFLMIENTYEIRLDVENVCWRIRILPVGRENSCALTCK